MEDFRRWYFISDILIMSLGSEFERMMGADGAVLFSRGRRVEGFRGEKGYREAAGGVLTLRLTSLQDRIAYGRGPDPISGQNRNWRSWQRS